MICDLGCSNLGIVALVVEPRHPLFVVLLLPVALLGRAVRVLSALVAAVLAPVRLLVALGSLGAVASVGRRLVAAVLVVRALLVPSSPLFVVARVGEGIVVTCINKNNIYNEIIPTTIIFFFRGKSMIALFSSRLSTQVDRKKNSRKRFYYYHYHIIYYYIDYHYHGTVMSICVKVGQPSKASFIAEKRTLKNSSIPI